MSAEEMYIVWNSHNAKFREIDGITTTQVSETLPNQTMPMDEMIDRYVRGQDIPGLKNYGFDSDLDDYYPDVEHMSKTEIAQMQLDIAEQIRETEQALINSRKHATHAEALQQTTEVTPLPDPTETGPNG